MGNRYSINWLVHVSVDGTDFRIKEAAPYPFSSFSHKFNEAAVKSKVVVSVESGDIVHINDPFRAGDWPDNSIFRDGLIVMLDKDERVEANDGY